MRVLLPALFLFAGASASAQSGPSPAVVVLQHTRTGGLEVLAPDAPRAEGSDAAVVVWADGGWTLRTLGAGETTRGARAATVRPVMPARPVRAAERARQYSRLLGSSQRDDRPVQFSVTVDLPALSGASPSETAAALASVLDEDDALLSLSIQTVNATRTSVAAEFAFESVEAWTEWSRRSLAWRRLEALGSPRTRLSIQR